MMPKCTLGPTTIFIKDEESGEMLELGNVEKLELEEIQIEHESINFGVNYVRYPQEVSVSYKLKTISRKKFIKLLMAKKYKEMLLMNLLNTF